MLKRLFAMLVGVNLIVAVAAYNLDLLPVSLAFAENDAKGQDQLKLELIEDLKKKQEELAAREANVASREERIKSLELDLDKKITELKRLQAKLDELIKMRDDLEDENISALSKTYSSMSPAEAADRLTKMDRNIALKILTLIKAKQASRIFSNMSAEVATEMTEQLAKRRFPE